MTHPAASHPEKWGGEEDGGGGEGVARRMALLAHAMPGHDHFDWLLESIPGDDPDERVLIAFQIPSRIDQFAAPATISAIRLPAHRRLYLTYEGPISQDRGVVSRVTTGVCQIEAESYAMLAGRCRFHAGASLAFKAAADPQSGPDAWQIDLNPAY